MNTNNNNETLTSESEASVEIVLVKSEKPKDPLYFQKYSQEKLRGAKHFCETCSKYIAKDKKARHAATKKHITNNEEKERQIEKENRTHVVSLILKESLIFF